MRTLLPHREGHLCCSGCENYESYNEYYDNCVCSKNGSRQKLENEQCCPECEYYEDCYLDAVYGGTVESAVNREITKLFPIAFENALNKTLKRENSIASRMRDIINTLRQEKEEISRNIKYMIDIVASTKKYYYQYAKDNGVKIDDAKIFPIPEGGIKHE